MKAFKEDAALRNGEKGSCKRSGEKKSEDGTKWEAKPEKKECSGSKEKTAVVHEKFALEKLTEGEASPLPSKLFHHREGVAATTPASQSCTDLYPDEALGDEVEGDLGLGRVVAEKERLPPGDALVGMGDIGIWLQGRIDGLLFLLCRVKPSGKIFPLPSSLSTLGALFPLEPDPVMSWLRCLVLSLNSLNGEGLEMSNPPTEFHKKILSGLIEDCRRIVAWADRITPVTWEEFFRVRGVDYKGEEILSAQPIRWENVAPALPDEVGGVPVEDVVELGSLEYVKNFSKYLLDPADQVYTRPPRVMVAPEHWETLCANLLAKGVFSKIHEDDVFKVDGKLILNGLFGVSKHEFQNGFEVMRIIMNLIPANRLVRTLDSDIATLPSWSGMTPLVLMPHENLCISSEDVRCFFYIFRLPPCWFPLMAFNRPLPDSLKGDKPGRWFPCSAVLPMGFKNSVALAQHIHRFIAKRALGKARLGGEIELRKDRPFSVGNPLFRIYLDNFDELARVSKDVARAIAGKVSPLVSCLREEYAVLGVPRHPKKGVSSQSKAEVQGAIVEGEAGIAYPKPEKMIRYAWLAKSLLEATTCTQKQMQVVGGGLVYLAMFRRPLLGSLNSVWKFILSFEGYPPIIKLPIPKEVKLELARFVGLVPLAYMDFRCTVSRMVTASDASKSGGGVTASCHVSPAGCVAAQCPVRGDLVEPADVTQVVTVGLFDGLGALRVAADTLGWNVVGHISVEKDDRAARVVESRFPNSIRVHDVAEIDEAMVQGWSLKFSQAGLILLGAGPPCQGVSGLNAARKGALKDARSSLFTHVSRVRTLLRSAFPWAQIRTLMESVASMDQGDREVMSADFGDQPWMVDAAGVSLARRPRLYWVDWELVESCGAVLCEEGSGQRSVQLNAVLNDQDFLLPGWSRVSSKPLPTFTTSRPRSSAGYKPAGLHQCNEEEKERWVQDAYRFPPYQYCNDHCLVNKAGALRLPAIDEREVIMGFPRHYTTMCMGKQFQGSVAHVDCRLSLIGNSWNVTVVAWLMSCLGSLLGLNQQLTVQQVVNRTSPGCTSDFQTFLQRPWMRRGPPVIGVSNEERLVSKLLTLVSIKGEDLMLNASTEDQVKYHRLRASVPSKLWKWKTITGWTWRDNAEHINILEMRAVLTALRWRVEKHKLTNSKFVHLLDSLVCLHSLSRGRSSSAKLRRSLLRINSLLLATKCQVVWAYVHTKDNPADTPSRYPRKRKWRDA